MRVFKNHETRMSIIIHAKIRNQSINNENQLRHLFKNDY